VERRFQTRDRAESAAWELAAWHCCLPASISDSEASKQRTQSYKQHDSTVMHAATHKMFSKRYRYRQGSVGAMLSRLLRSWSHRRMNRLRHMASAMPDPRLPSQVPSCRALPFFVWYQIILLGVNSMPKVNALWMLPIASHTMMPAEGSWGDAKPPG